MDPADRDTIDLLASWHERKDTGTLEALLERHLPRIRQQVRRSLGPALRSKEQTEDMVQDAAIEFLRYGPQFQVKSAEHFRALVARIVKNTLCDKADWYQAKRRALERERPLPSDTVLNLGADTSADGDPADAAADREWEAWVRLGLELLEPEDREVMLLRQWEERSFEEIGTELGINADAARMRFNRALPRLAKAIESLQSGEVADPEA